MKILLLSFLISSYGIINPAKMVRIIDGDSYIMQIQLSNQGIYYIGAVRLDGGDTPESTFRSKCKQEKLLGIKATKFVIKWFDTHGKYVMIRTQRREKFGRWLGVVETYEGINLGDDLTSAGYAVKYNGGKKHDWCKN